MQILDNETKHKFKKEIIILVISSCLFLILIALILNKDSKEHMKEINNQIKVMIELDINNNIESLEAIVRFIGNEVKEYKNDYDKIELIEDIDISSSSSSFEYIGIVNKEGYLKIYGDEYKNTSQIYVGNRDYFKKGMKGQLYISQILQNRVNGNDSIIYSLPLIIDGQPEAVVVGVSDCNNLGKSLNNTITYHEGCIYIIDSKGNIIVGEENSGQNIFNKYIKQGANAKKINKIKKQLKGNYQQNVYKIKINDVNHYLGYKFIDSPNNWYVISKASVKEVFKDTKNVLDICIICIIIVIFAFIINNVYKYKKNKAKLYKANYIDKLTNINNYNKFKKDCENILENKILKETYAILTFDINNFKSINQSLGYEKGDFILKHIANNLQKLEFENINCRISKDVFALMFKFNNEKELIDKVKIINNNILKLQENDTRHNLNMSIGIYIVKNTKEFKISKMIDNANSARKEIKHDYKRNYYIYNETLKVKIQQEKLILNKLKQCLENGEFNVVYQPKVNIQSEKIVGAEALIRWNNKEIGFISPAIFIPIAEKNGDIKIIGRWVLKEVCKNLRKCNLKNEKVVPISINISRIELYEDDLITFIKDIINKYEISPNLLEIEITETVALNDIDYINKKIKDIKELGIKVSMDDFGTGSSTLSNLKLIDIDILKIDRSLLIDIENNEKSEQLVSSIIKLAKKYRLKVVCEGVENMHQVEILKKLECDIVQGFVFYRPLDLQDFKNKLKIDDL